LLAQQALGKTARVFPMRPRSDPSVTATWKRAAFVLAAVFALGCRGTPQVSVTPLVPSGPVKRWRDGSREVVEVTWGSYEISVKRGLFDRPVVLRLPDGEVDDLGTVFRVNVALGRTARIAVYQGAVMMRLRSGMELLLIENTAWEPAYPVPILSGPPIPYSTVPPPPAPDAGVALLPGSQPMAAPGAVGPQVPGLQPLGTAAGEAHSPAAPGATGAPPAMPLGLQPSAAPGATGAPPSAKSPYPALPTTPPALGAQPPTAAPGATGAPPPAKSPYPALPTAPAPTGAPPPPAAPVQR
jgi:hypothetical protein